MKTNIFKMVGPFIVKHQPEILISMGITSMIFSTLWGIKATVKACEAVQMEKHALKKDKLSTGELFKTVWRFYLPVAVSMGIAIPCIITGNRIATKRGLALAAAYSISEAALQEYQDKTKEVVGAKNYEKIQESISADTIANTYKEGVSNVTLIGDGDCLFFEPLSARYFKTNWNRISKAANELNATAMGEVSGTITLGEWYSILGLDRTELDDLLGWSISNGKQGIIDISVDSVMTPDNQPCGSIRYNTVPKTL